MTGLQKRLTLLSMGIAQGMILLDVTIVNVALPSIQRELHASSSNLEWIISAYALSLAALIPLSGALGDRFGRKRLFAIGMVVFALGSVACALSPSAPDLIGARARQGVGGAIMSALALSILSDTYSGRARAGAIGIWATVAGLGFGLGPVVGGLLLGPFGWSSIFWVNVPFAVAGVVLTVTVVPDSRNPDTRPLDVPGVLASAAGLLALTFGLIESLSSSWTSDRACRTHVGSIQCVPSSGHLCGPRGPRCCRRRRGHVCTAQPRCSSPGRSARGGNRASSQHRERPHWLGDESARTWSKGTRRPGLFSRI